MKAVQRINFCCVFIVFWSYSMPPKSKSNSPTYSEKDIKYLEPREHIRLRPGMYIGGTDSRALHHMIYEVLDNAVEEVMIGECNRITVTLRANHTMTIEDNTTGLPVEEIRHPNDVSILAPHFELIMTALVSKPKFDDKYYGVSGGLHGLGLSAVNSLSKACSVQVRRDGFLWEQFYEEGIPVTSVKRIRPLQDDETTGNTITFQPDFTIMDENEFDFQVVAIRCQDLAYLFPAITITLRDLRGEYLVEEIYYAPNGLADLVSELNVDKPTIHPVIQTQYIEQVLDINNSPIDVGVSLAFQFSSEVGMTLEGFINSVPTSNYGIHSESFLEGVVTVIKNATNTNFRIGQKRMGFTGAIHIQHPAPDFRSPTKVNLRNPELPAIVMNIVQQAIHEHPEAFALLVQYIAES
jgi:DNA gyrase subunit B